MSKKIMWILLILATLFLVVGGVFYFTTFIPFFLAISTASSSKGLPRSFPIAGFVITFVSLMAGNVLELVGRIGALIRQAKQQQWGWFVCTLLLGWVCLLIYLIVWPQPPRPGLPPHPYVPKHHYPQTPPRKRTSKKH